MPRARSRAGTAIAFDRSGEGPPIILVGGAFQARSAPKMTLLAELIAPRFTVISYDRRGRGKSEDTEPYSVEREIEDLDALIGEAGGSACLFGMSSGGCSRSRQSPKVSRSRGWRYTTRLSWSTTAPPDPPSTIRRSSPR
jgi:pimeloyl-ACP methyl ester carboxylesterase